eukprot:GFUD01023023.1.p1 GENE.GFUD01023023.1~~GFUD01023023.1.p1  ORF type:complete len:196 (-),score=77.81 GFUD01023023.1:924-1511(-)
MSATEYTSRVEQWKESQNSNAFKTAVEDFERARGRMREETEKTWRRWEEERKKFFGESDKRFLDDMKRFDDGWMSDSIFDKSFDEMKNSIRKRRDMFVSEDIDKAKVAEDNTKMEVSLDTTGYKPSELSVNVCKGMICVMGKHEEKSEEGKVMVLREFTRKYTLPRDARAEDVESSLLKDGTLRVTAKKVGQLMD